MSLKDKTDEMKRLIQSFETEAAKFHPLTLSTLYVTQADVSSTRVFAKPNHAVMLWQYYGQMQGDDDASRLATNINDSDMQWGVRGADISNFGILEGEGCELFVRMAQRAGSLFDEDEAHSLKMRVLKELIAKEQERHTTGKPTAVSNNNPLALWLNYLLYYLSLTNPGREFAKKIEPDPFALSLLALEQLYTERVISKVDRSNRPLRDLIFKVAMSFPGEHRPYVATVVQELRSSLNADSIFYDHDYQAQLARPNMDVLLQDIYHNRSELVVVYLCKEYSGKQWCGLEWRAIRDLIKTKDSEKIMLVRFDDTAVDGVFSIDGYIDARQHNPQQLAAFILQRLPAKE